MQREKKKKKKKRKEKKEKRKKKKIRREIIKQITNSQNAINKIPQSQYPKDSKSLPSSTSLKNTSLTPASILLVKRERERERERER